MFCIRSTRSVCSYPYRMSVIVGVGLLSMLQFGAFAQPPLLFPGQSMEFSTPAAGRVVPDDVDGFVERLFLAQAAIASDSIAFQTDVVPLSGFARVSTPLSRALTYVYQYNDFEIDAGDGSETVVSAQLSGTVNVKGYMLLVGFGNVREILGIDVIDITNDPNDLSNIVASETFRTYELDPDPGISMSTDVGALLGSATLAEAKAGLSLGVNVPIAKKVIRENFGFGFNVLLRRGHTYRLLFSSQGRAKLGPNAGLGIASFWSPIANVPPFLAGDSVLNVPPSLIDPQVWLTSLDMPMLDKTIPKINFPDVGEFNFGNFGWFADFNDTNDVLRELNIPTNVRGLVNRFFSNIIPDEAVAQPGVDLRQMQVTLATDQVELLNMVSYQVEELKQIILRHPPFSHGPEALPPTSNGDPPSPNLNPQAVTAY